MDFRSKTILGVALIEVVLLASLIVYGLSWLRISNEAELKNRAHNIVELLATAAKEPVLTNNIATLDAFISRLIRQQGIVYVRIYNNHTLLAKGVEKSASVLPIENDTKTTNIINNIYDVSEKIAKGNKVLGHIELGLSMAHINDIVAEAREKAPFIALIGITLSALFSWLLGSYLTRQLARLKKAAHFISEGNIGHQIVMPGNDELANTAKSINKMSSSLKKMYDELSDSLNNSRSMSNVLQQRELYTNAILNNVADVVVSTDRNGHVKSVNESVEKMFGHKKHEVIDRCLTVLIPAELNGVVDNYLRDGNMDGVTDSLIDNKREFSARHKDGHIFPVAMSVNAVNLDHDVLFVGLIEDITDEKNTQQELIEAKLEAESASKAKSEFLANMSHEIRTPMNGVIGMLELLSKTELNEQQRKYIRTASSSAELLLNIINDILDFSKIEAGKLTVEYISFNIRQVVEDIAELLNQQINHKQVELCCFVDTNVPEHIYGDPSRLSQILINLAGNAIKFTSSGEISIRITCRKHVNDRFLIYFEVKDSGIGIAENKLNMLFKPFQQADGSTSRRFGGTGLGLTICKQLIEIMGGEISASSTAGKGSVFWFEIEFRGAEEVTDSVAGSLQGKIILIVDDNKTNLEIMSNYLCNAGAMVYETAIGKELIEAANSMVCKNRAVDLIILDMQMPDMDGIETAKQLKLDPVTKNIPLVLVSSFGLLENIPLEAGIDLCVSKPFRQRQFMHQLSLLLSGELSASNNEQNTIAFEQLCFPNARILLVEDNIVNQEMAVEMLRLLHIEPILAANGLEAVEAFKFNEFDLVLMDCQMPILDGYAATRQIREYEQSSDLQPTPVIALTANAMEADKELCIAAGMDGHIAKPVRLSSIENLLMRWLPDKKNSQKPLLKNNKAMNAVSNDISLHIEIETYNELIDRLGDRMRVIMDKFILNTDSLIKDIASSAGDKDFATVINKAHTLKGSSLSVAAVRLSTLSQQLEQQAKQDGGADLSVLVDEIKAEFLALKMCINGLNGNKKIVEFN